VSATYPENLRDDVERYLAELRFSEEALTSGLEEAMRYSLLGGGKRIRPVLALATARAVGMEPQEVMPLAAALELVHTYSLIHDDLPAMDDDALRRGQPTCHVKFGEGVAILAGDGLYAEAFHHLLTHQRSAPERVLLAAAELAAATGVNGMVGGQYVDVEAGTSAGGASLRRLHELKTGRLIGASVLCVLLLGGVADGPAAVPLRLFASELGVLFQIVDDILDVTGTDDALGKPRGSDERHGKQTYVSEFGIDRAKELAAESHATAVRALSEAAGRTPAAAAVVGAGARRDPRGEQATDELERIADFIYTRSS
jgi:geranylgeranyl diphosphate synthase type II